MDTRPLKKIKKDDFDVPESPNKISKSNENKILTKKIADENSTNNIISLKRNKSYTNIDGNI
jgi:hypothetical protein